MECRDFCHRHIQSMRFRLLAVQQSHGGQAKYGKDEVAEMWLALSIQTGGWRHE
jgi:hypothetical protein